MCRATLPGLAALALALATGCPSPRSPAPAPAPTATPREDPPAEPPVGDGPRLKSPPGALPGRTEAMPVPAKHDVLGTPLAEPFPVGLERAVFAMGCFWGAEKQFWGLPGVYTTAVGYTAGVTPNATYDEVCTGRTGHAEAVLVVYDPRKTTYEALLKVFWEGHDPTCGDRQGNDVGTQYRSGCYTTTDAQARAAVASRDAYQAELTRAGHGAITTEVQPATDFFYAEKYHQQYLAKHPNGYCGHGGTGVSCPVGLGK